MCLADQLDASKKKNSFPRSWCTLSRVRAHPARASTACVINRAKDAKETATLIHHSACRHFSFPLSAVAGELFSTIICHDGSRCTIPPLFSSFPLPFPITCNPRMQLTACTLRFRSRSKEVCGATSAVRECIESLCTGRPRRIVANSKFSRFLVIKIFPPSPLAPPSSAPSHLDVTSPVFLLFSSRFLSFFLLLISRRDEIELLR